MKKTLLILAALSALPTLAAVAPVTTVAPQVTLAAPEPSPLNLEIGFVYGFANNDLFREGETKVDVSGFDVGSEYRFDEHHSFTLRLGWTYGEESVSESYSSYYYGETDEISMFTLMPGYRYTGNLAERLSAYAGVNVGIANVSVEASAHGAINGTHLSLSGDESEVGVAYSVELGLKYACTPNCDMFVGYQFFGSTATPSQDVYGVSVHQKNYHGVRAGVNIKF